MDAVWFTRLRWRMRGALLWPVFGLLTIVDAVLLVQLPVYGTGPDGTVPALLLATALNLICVAVLAPLAGALLRRRRGDLPRAVAADRAGVALLTALACGLALAGLVNRADALDERADERRQARAVAHYVRTQAPAYVPGLAAMDSIRLSRDYFRSCVPGRDPRRWLCLFVDTARSPAGVTRDTEALPYSLTR